MVPKIGTKLPGGGPWGVQGGLGLVLVRSFVRLVARVRFLDILALLLGPFSERSWASFGATWASLRLRGALFGIFLGGLLVFLYRLRASPKMFHPFFV